MHAYAHALRCALLPAMAMAGAPTVCAGTQLPCCSTPALPQQVVYVGDRPVDYNPAFRLLLVTRAAAPVLSPDVAPLLTVINFSTTCSGLESELVVACQGVFSGD